MVNNILENSHELQGFFKTFCTEDGLHITDLVPCIQCYGWPDSATEWITRKRLWPDEKTIDDIIQSGFHLICCNLENEWRLSFSLSELQLANKMTAEQKAVYCVFKCLIKEGCKESEILTSYYLKTVFLWALERIPSHEWTVDKYISRVLDLMDDLIMHVTQKTCLLHQKIFMP